MGRMLRLLLLSGLLALSGPARAAETVSVKTADGLTALGTLSLAPGAGLGDGVVVMLHGTLQHRGQEILGALQERLNGEGINTLAISLSLGVDGREGPYDCTLPHRHRHQDGPAELAAWVDWLKSRGAGPVTLLGHSRGGNQVARYLAGRPDPLVARAVLVAPMTGLDGAKAGGMLDMAAGQADDTLVAVPEFLVCPAGRASAGSIRAYHGDDGAFATPALLADVTTPVLVLAGADDTVVPDLPAAMAKLDNPQVRFTMIDMADHFFRDFAADDAAAAVVAFIRP